MRFCNQDSERYLRKTKNCTPFSKFIVALLRKLRSQFPLPSVQIQVLYLPDYIDLELFKLKVVIFFVVEKWLNLGSFSSLGEYLSSFLQF